VVEFQDKVGRVFDVIPCKEEGLEKLLAFYDIFEPKGEYEGIPPAEKQARTHWVEGLISHWQNFLVNEGEQIVGHVAVTLGEGPVQELIIFLHQDYRGQGVGSEALIRIQDWLKQKGPGKFWLTVKNTNRQAIRCFQKVGFQFMSPPLEPEREMVLEIGEQG
jgi:RimJ/RimL family protein N-acetyltransferase